MRIIVLLIISFFLPVYSHAHPGKTDDHGGHKCWKKCGEWELQYAEYHLHDENWKPIHLDKSGTPIKHEKTEAAQEVSSDNRPEQVPGQVNITANAGETGQDARATYAKNSGVKNDAPQIQEEGILPFNIIFILLALLLFLLFLRRRRNKD